MHHRESNAPQLRELAIPSGAIDQLTNHQTQLDVDGIFVGVSRQALDELLTFAASALELQERLENPETVEEVARAINKTNIRSRGSANCDILAQAAIAAMKGLV